MRNVSKCFYAVDVVLKFITGYKRLKAKSTISLPKFLISLLIGLQFQSKIFSETYFISSLDMGINLTFWKEHRNTRA